MLGHRACGVRDAAEPAQLDNNTVQENKPIGTVVGTLSSSDPDGGTTFTYQLVGGTGDTDNGKFKIVGDKLTTRVVLNYEAQQTASVRVRVTDAQAESNRSVFSIQITNDTADDPPPPSSARRTSRSPTQTVAENQLPETVVGTLTATDADPGDTFTYKLVAGGVGAADNTSFHIVGDQLKTKVPLDYETKSSLAIRIQVTDSQGHQFPKRFTITVTDNNDAPSDVTFSNLSVAENSASGSTVGTASTTDQDAGDTHTYTLVPGPGDDDNASFTIDGVDAEDRARSFDFETKNEYSVRVQTDDGNGGTFEKAFTVTVTDANDAPTDIALSASSVAENQPAATAVGTLSSTDQDAGDTFTYTLVAGDRLRPTTASFQITGDKLQTDAAFDFEAKTQLHDPRADRRRQRRHVREGSSRSRSPTSTRRRRTSRSRRSSVAENQPVGHDGRARCRRTDQDAGDTFTYTLVAGPATTDNASFQISRATKLQTNAVFDFETKTSYSIRVRDRRRRRRARSTKQFTITVTDVNEAPTDIALSPSSVAENQPSGTDGRARCRPPTRTPGDTFTYTLVGGDGRRRQRVVPDLRRRRSRPTRVFDFEAKSSYSIRVQVDRRGRPDFEKAVHDHGDRTSTRRRRTSRCPAASVAENQADRHDGRHARDHRSGRRRQRSRYILVAGRASTDNGVVPRSSGDELQTSAVFDFETQASYSIRVRIDRRQRRPDVREGVHDHGDQRQRDAPTDIALSPSSVAENQPVGTTVGTLRATDPDAGDTFTYTLVAGAGDDRQRLVHDRPAARCRTARASTSRRRPATRSASAPTDGRRLDVREAVHDHASTNVNETPTDIALSPSSVAENQPSAPTVGTLQPTDPDAGDTFTYTLVAGSGDDRQRARSRSSASSCRRTRSFDFETKSSYSIRVQADRRTAAYVREGVHDHGHQRQRGADRTSRCRSATRRGEPAGRHDGRHALDAPIRTPATRFTLHARHRHRRHRQRVVPRSSAAQLQTTRLFDFETKNSYSIRVRTTDAAAA